ncbi:YfcC family protein [Carnimonas nigrificans]|uniref:YfcC family protein n=1 Tax=Carnimonas nigrificans TaxID=64323 RepID=UPI0004711E7D|nr:YfcC family protein [Carnimonas nigrificans]
MAKKNSQTSHSSLQNPYVLLFCMLVLAGAASWLIPAGQYETEKRNGISFSIPGSYHAVASHGVLPQDLFLAIGQGLISSAPIVFMVMFTGGALRVLEQSGAIAHMLYRISSSKRFNDFTLVLTFFVVFSILGTTGIIVNSVIAFVPLGIMVARSLGLGKLFGISFVYVATYTGYNASITSPTSVGVAQQLAEVPLMSGIGYRSVIYVLFLFAAMAFMWIKIKRARASSQHRELDSGDDTAVIPSAPSGHPRRHALTLIWAAICLVAYITGAILRHWESSEMLAMFVIMSLGVGIISRMSADTIAQSFLAGCAQLVGGAFVVGLARAVSVILHQGVILDTIVYYSVQVLNDLPHAFTAIGMLFSAMIMHFFISSGSGESAVLIPIFAPIGDVLEITRQTTVQTAVLGEGVVNCINPTSGVLMAILATSKVPFTKWVKFILPLVLVWLVISIVALYIAVQINWGPI